MVVSTLKYLLCILTATLLFHPTAAANELFFGRWQTTGSQEWHISFPPNGASKLYYPQNAQYFLVNYCKPLGHKTLQLEFGSNQVSLGTGNDSDWDYTKNNDLWYYGKFNSAGHSYFANFNINTVHNKHSIFYYGYGYHHNEFTMTNGLYLIENYSPVSDLLPDLNSKYTITYQGPQLGLITESSLNNRLSFLSSITYSPLAMVNAHGWWNLRSLEFTQTGSAQMFDGNIALRYKIPSKNNKTLFLGYRYQQLSLIKGTENTSSSIVWDKAAHIQKGSYFGTSISL